MARVTVEDCVQVIPNRYELVLLAAQRARDIAAGSRETVDRDNDKNPVIALREIAEQTINLDELKRHIARGVNRYSDFTNEDDALLALTAGTAPSDEPTAESVFGAIDIAEVDFEEEEAPAKVAVEAAPEGTEIAEDDEAELEAALAAKDTGVSFDEMAAVEGVEVGEELAEGMHMEDEEEPLPTSTPEATS